MPVALLHALSITSDHERNAAKMASCSTCLARVMRIVLKYVIMLRRSGEEREAGGKDGV